MSYGQGRFLTTHIGSLPRAEDLMELMWAREDGLPLVFINTLAQTSDGVIWAGSAWNNLTSQTSGTASTFNAGIWDGTYLVGIAGQSVYTNNTHGTGTWTATSTGRRQHRT